MNLLSISAKLSHAYSYIYQISILRPLLLSQQYSKWIVKVLSSLKANLLTYGLFYTILDHTETFFVLFPHYFICL